MLFLLDQPILGRIHAVERLDLALGNHHRLIDDPVQSGHSDDGCIPQAAARIYLPPPSRRRRAPDVLIFDGQGLAHPRRFGVACHGGVLFGVPSIGCAKSLLVGRHGELGRERGSTAELVDGEEVVGMAVRMRTGVKPVYVSPGHLMDLPIAVEVVLAASRKCREPETTRHAHRLVNDPRRSDARPVA